MSRVLDYMSYAEWLASPRWAEIRAEALARDGGRCRICNNSMTLEGHHRTYETLGTPEEVEDVTVLCNECHELFSERLPTTSGVSSRALSDDEAPLAALDGQETANNEEIK